MTEHRDNGIEIIPLRGDPYHQRRRFEITATCICGWKSNVYDGARNAWAELDDHLEATARIRGRDYE